MANDNDLLLQNAKWFASELGNIKAGSHAKMLQAGKENNYEAFRKAALESNRSDSERLWQGWLDWKAMKDQGQGVPLAAPKLETETPKEDHPNHTEHVDHAPHYQDEGEPEENPSGDKKTDALPETPEKKITPDEAEQRLRDATEVGKGKNITPESTAEYLEGLRQKNIASQTSPLIIPVSRIKAQPSPPTPQPNTTEPSPPRYSNPPSRRNPVGLNVPGAGLAKGAAKRGVKSVAKKGLAWLFGTPMGQTVLAGILAIAFVIFVAFLIMARLCELTNGIIRPDWLHQMCTDNSSIQNIPPPPKGVTIVKSATGDAADGSVDNGDPITYSITITYNPREAEIPTENMVVVDVPDFDFDSIGPSTTGNYTRTGGRIEWSLADFIDQRPDANGSSESHTFQLALIPNENVQDTYVRNSVWIDTTEEDDTAPVNCSGDPRDCLRDEFNLIAEGDYTRNELLDVYKIFSEIGVAPRYKSLLYSSGPTRLIFQNGTTGGCPGRVVNRPPARIQFILENYTLSGCSRTTRKSRLAHESGHVIKGGHPRLFDEFTDTAYNRDSGCYHSDSRANPPYFLNTYDEEYGLDRGFEITGNNESFAEFIALHVIPQGRYPQTCPRGYSWIKANIFNGYEY